MTNLWILGFTVSISYNSEFHISRNSRLKIYYSITASFKDYRGKNHISFKILKIFSICNQLLVSSSGITCLNFFFNSLTFMSNNVAHCIGRKLIRCGLAVCIMFLSLFLQFHYKLWSSYDGWSKLCYNIQYLLDIHRVKSCEAVGLAQSFVKLS